MVRIKIGLGHVLVNRNPNRVPRRPVLVVEKDAIGCLSRICRSASRGSVRGYQHASGGAYRERFDISRRVLVPLLLISVVGGVAGAILLLRTPAHTFMRVIPWLMLGATLLFAFGKKLYGNRPSGLAHDASTNALFWACVFEFFVAVYGGYFGGGVGIINLAMLAALGMTDIHAMNALKVVLGGVINGVAVVTFIAAHAIVWREGTVMTIGAIAGGYSAAHYSQKLPQAWIRAFVILVGSAMTIYFFYKAYHL